MDGSDLEDIEEGINRIADAIENLTEKVEALDDTAMMVHAALKDVAGELMG